MAIIEVKKVFAVVLKKDVEKILQKLQQMGVMEISKAAPEEESLFSPQENQERIVKIESTLQSVRNALQVIARFSHSKKSFFEPKPAMTVGELRGQQENIEMIRQVVLEANQIEERMNDIKIRHSKLSNQIAQLEPFFVLDAPVEDICPTEHVQMFCGYVQKEAVHRLDELMLKYDGLLMVQHLEGTGEFLPVFVVLHKSVATEVRADMKEVAFSEVHFEGFTGTIQSRLKALKESLTALDEERLTEEKKAEQIADNKLLLLAYEDYLMNQLESENAYARLGTTASVNIIEGYIKQSDEAGLQKALSEITDAYYLTVSEPDEGDDVPTVVENKSLLRPFEAVTDLYSVPAYSGIDPVFVLAPFFFLLFGMMMADAGYGILLSIGSILLLKFKKPTGMFRKVTMIIGICGLSTVVWGLLLGGFFSIDSVQPLLFNPLKEPLLMLGLCMGMGFVHVFAAVATGFYMLAKKGQWLDAIFDKGFWMVVLLSVPVMLLAGTQTGLYVMAAGLFGVLCTAGRSKKGIAKKIIGGLGRLYDITGYFSDILSYSRIFGLALAGAVVGMVFNIIAGMMMNGLGWIFAIPILMVGHGFNIGVNALGSYVHTSRLQYIESFGKFFESGGRAFKPLTYTTKNFRMELNK